MLTLKKVAITGGLSCGKSTVCRFFEEFGACVVSADEIVHKILSSNTPLAQKVKLLIGLDSDSSLPIDRKFVAKKVFNNPSLLKKLEALLHPAVKKSIEEAYTAAKQSKEATLFVAEIPLLFETQGESDFDAVIVVEADEQTALKRFKETKGYQENDYRKRMERQIPLEEKKRKATFVMNNQGTLEDLKKQTKLIYQQLITQFNEESDR